MHMLRSFVTSTACREGLQEGSTREGCVGRAHLASSQARHDGAYHIPPLMYRKGPSGLITGSWLRSWAWLCGR